MICYQTDEQGYLLYPTQATLDPEETRIQEKDVWTLPRGCVAKAPPSQKKGCLLRWVEGRWINEPIPEPEAAPEPEAQPEIEPLGAAEKLALFLRMNPDVKELVGL